MTKQPEALRLADLQDSGYFKAWRDTSNELRRLNEQNQELLAALKLALPSINPKAVDRKRVQNEPVDDCYVNTIVRKLIEKVEAV